LRQLGFLGFEPDVSHITVTCTQKLLAKFARILLTNLEWYGLGLSLLVLVSSSWSLSQSLGLGLKLLVLVSSSWSLSQSLGLCLKLLILVSSSWSLSQVLVLGLEHVGVSLEMWILSASLLSLHVRLNTQQPYSIGTTYCVSDV